MENKIYQEVAAEERERTLKQLSYGVAQEDYVREFTPEEQREKNDEFVRESSKLFKEETRVKAEIKALNDSLKDKKKAVSKVLSDVQAGGEDVSGVVYLFDDQVNNKMGVYDPAGNLLYERTLKPEEKQMHISSSNAM